MTSDNLTLVLAQDGAPDRPVAPDNPSETVTFESTQDPSQQTPLDNGGGGGFNLLTMLLPVALFFIIISMMGGRKDKKKRAAMMKAMAKGDKVQTVGGILGTVVEIRDDEIIVKVDENANTRLRFARTAIQSILESKNAD